MPTDKDCYCNEELLHSPCTSNNAAFADVTINPYCLKFQSTESSIKDSHFPITDTKTNVTADLQSGVQCDVQTNTVDNGNFTELVRASAR